MSSLAANLRSFWRWLASKHSRPALFPPDLARGWQFSPIDPETVIRRLRLREKAQTNGSSDIPKSDAMTFDGPQEEIVQFVQAHCASNISTARVELAGYSERISSTELSPLLNEICDAPERFETDCAAATDERKLQLEMAEERLAEQERRYSDFRNALEIRRDPHYPESRTWNLAILALVVLLESLLNGYFFALGHEYGVLGGAWFALSLAAVDVVMCFLLGRLLVRVLSPARVHRLTGAGASILAILWAFGYNLAVAHVREAMLEFSFSEAMTKAWGTFLRNPLGLTSADTWVLFLLGLLFSVMALVDAAAWDDPIPSYGALHRELLSRRGDRDEIRLELRRIVPDLADQAIRRIDALAKDAQSHAAALEHELKMKRTLLENVHEYIRSLERASNAIIRIYRDENQRHRNTPPPAYFDERWSHPLSSKLADDLTADEQHAKEQKHLLEKILDETRRARTQIAQRKERTMQDLERMSPYVHA